MVQFLVQAVLKESTVFQTHTSTYYKHNYKLALCYFKGLTDLSADQSSMINSAAQEAATPNGINDLRESNLQYHPKPVV